MDLLGVLILVPILGVVVARRRVFRPTYHLDHARLDASDQKPTLGSHLLAVGALYTAVCVVAGTGRLFGWLDGMRLARAGAGPAYLTPDASGASDQRGDRGREW